jgi:hypothetical protein
MGGNLLSHPFSFSLKMTLSSSPQIFHPDVEEKQFEKDFPAEKIYTTDIYYKHMQSVVLMLIGVESTKLIVYTHRSNIHGQS